MRYPPLSTVIHRFPPLSACHVLVPSAGHFRRRGHVCFGCRAFKPDVSGYTSPHPSSPVNRESNAACLSLANHMSYGSDKKQGPPGTRHKTCAPMAQTIAQQYLLQSSKDLALREVVGMACRRLCSPTFLLSIAVFHKQELHSPHSGHHPQITTQYTLSGACSEALHVIGTEQLHISLAGPAYIAPYCTISLRASGATCQGPLMVA